MKPRINWKSEDTKAFSQLERGDVFVFGGELYMKINPVNDAEGSIAWNSVRIATGCFAWFGSHSAVKPVDVEVTVKEAKE